MLELKENFCKELKEYKQEREHTSKRENIEGYMIQPNSLHSWRML